MRQLARIIALLVAVALPGFTALPARATAGVTVTVTLGGSPLEDAFVALTGDNGRYAGISAADGTLTFSDVPDGSYTLYASAPGTRVGSQAVSVAADPVSVSMALTDSGNKFDGLGAYGAQTAGIAADGASGVFYLTTTAVPSFYRTADYGGSWAPVTITADDADDGIDGSDVAAALTTSGFPGEVAAFVGSRVWYSRNFGTTWDSLTAPPTGNGGSLLWGHVGSVSVLFAVNGSNTEMSYAVMPTTAGGSPSAFTSMSIPYKQNAADRVAIASGSSNPWFVVADGTGAGITMYLVDATPSRGDTSEVVPSTGTSGAPTFVRAGGPPAAAGHPDTVLVYTNDGSGSAVMASSASDGSGNPTWYPAATTVFHNQGNDGVASGGSFNQGPASCGGMAGSIGSVSPLGAAGTVSMCWVTQEGPDRSELHVRPVGGINNNTGLSFDAGYDGSTNLVLISGDGSKGAVKSASVDGALNRPSFPQWPALADAGTGSASGGVAIEGIGAAVVRDTAFGPGGAHQIAVMFSFSGGGRKIASLDGGETWTTLEARGGSSIEWWAGDEANEAWILSGSSSDQDMLAALRLDADADSADASVLDDALTGRHLSGTQANAWGVSGDPGRTSATAIVGLGGSDIAYVGTGAGDAGSFTTGALRRVALNGSANPPTASVFGSGTELTEIDNAVMALAYCPAEGSAASTAGKVYAALASNGGSDPGGIAVVSDATGDAPVVTMALNAATGTTLQGDFNDVRVDCAGGEVFAGKGMPPGPPPPGGASTTGLVRSTNGGASFAAIAVDPPAPPPGEPPASFTNVETLEVNPADPDEIAVVSSDGSVAVSGDGGDTWMVVNNASDDSGMSFGAEQPGDIELPEPAPAPAGFAPMTASNGEVLLGSGGGVFSADVDDDTPPSTPAMSSMSLFQVSKTFTVGWSAATDAQSGVVSYIVDRRYRKFNASAYTMNDGVRVQSGRTWAHTGASGYEYCFRVTARNGVGLRSAPSAWRCTVIPANDTDMTKTTGFARRTGTGFYLNSYSEATAAGQYLTIPVYGARVISLIATKCAGCGTVDVYVGTTLLKRVSLAASTTAKRQFIPITTSGVRSGTLKIRVYTSGKPVRVEGLAMSK